MKTNLLSSVLIVCLALMMVLSACGTSAPVATSTLPATVTSTAAPTLTATVTATPNLAATQQYDDFFAVVQKIHEAGQIPSMDGEYLELDDYRDEVAVKLSY